ncbi:proline-specific permease [Aspergillus luchuensis]|uniref:Proline-specific permease n=2 Tax=Aspergillus kawachii TaxID=1069201 RepID=A0A146F5J4_ASPKA|nr:proline-specific permease [Aspergillus luchuensis]
MMATRRIPDYIRRCPLKKVKSIMERQQMEVFIARSVHVISLGSSIGSGLFITTGKSLAQGGPANMFLAYLVVCVGVWANLQTLTEMTIAFPTSGNYIDYADRWVDPALAFGAGFAEWLGAGPSGYVRHGNTWTDLPMFKNGFGGFSTAALLAIWAVGDQVFIGVMAGEAESPHYSMARSANFVPWRVGIFYLVSVVLISLVVDSDDSRLINGSSVVSSPFVIAAQDAGISGVPDLINACIILGILALSLECIYLPSRILRTMSLQGLLPAFIAKVDKIGRPRWALTFTAVAGTVLTYLSLSGIERATLSELIQIDKHYLTRITLRTKLIQDKRASVLGASPRSIPAVKELYSFLINDYLPQRYSAIFQRTSTTTSTSASAPTTTMLRNTVTGETIPSTPPTDAEEALAIIGRQVEEDFLLLLPPQPSYLRDDDKNEGTNKQMTLEAFIGCFPNGFNWADKFRKSLANIHVPVPDYTTKLRASMDRYLERLKVGECVKRANWTVSVDGELHAASSMHLYEGEEVVELQELNVDMDVKKEGNGPRLVEAIAGLKEGSSPGFHFYKRAAVWQRAVSEYLLNGEEEKQYTVAQNLIPHILAITTPNEALLRYLCVPFMIWIYSLMLHPVRSPSHVTSLFANTAWFNILSALDPLLLNPKEADDFVAINEGTSRVKSFFYGLRTALKQHLNSRKINTPEEAKNTPPMPG